MLSVLARMSASNMACSLSEDVKCTIQDSDAWIVQSITFEGVRSFASMDSAIWSRTSRHRSITD